MDLKTFVETTILQVIEGVKAADLKAAELGGQVSPRGIKLESGSTGAFGVVDHLSQNNPVVLLMEFDVALEMVESGERGSDGGLNIKIATIGGKESTTHSEKTVSRVKFGVPVAFPGEFARGHEPPPKSANKKGSVAV